MTTTRFRPTGVLEGATNGGKPTCQGFRPAPWIGLGNVKVSFTLVN